MRLKPLTLLLIAIFLLPHCKSPLSTDIPDETEHTPHIKSFTATPSEISYGEYSNLSWNVTYATKITLNGESVSSTSSRLVSPTETTKYTLTAENEKGQAQVSLTVKVNIGLADVVMTWGPTHESIGTDEYHVKGGVKNVSTNPALNVKVKISLFNSSGDPLASGETILADDRLEPQEQAGWFIIFDDTYNVLDRTVDENKTVYDITWQ